VHRTAEPGIRSNEADLADRRQKEPSKAQSGEAISDLKDW